MRPRFLPAPARSGAPSLQLETEDGRLWVHSPVDPRAEAERQLERLDLDGRALLVVVGGGLGWLARAARDRRPAGVLVLEPEGDRATTESVEGAELRRGGAEALIAWVTERQLALGWPDLAVVHNPAYSRAFPAWAARLREALPPGRRPCALGARRPEGARRWPPRRALLLDSGYYLLREIREALEELGVCTLSVPLRQDGQRDPATSGTDSGADSRYVDRLLEAIAGFRPELVLAVNHLGLDRNGRVQDLLASLGLPLAVWYVDSPEYVIDGAAAAVREDTHLFCWERAWLPRLQALGFTRLAHLPLAGSRAFLRQAQPVRDFSLVAGSNAGAIAKWRGRLACPPCHTKELERLLDRAADFPRGELPDAELERRLARGASPAFRAWLEPGRRRRLCSLLVLQATQRDRAALARRFAGRDFALHGDAGWRALLPQQPLSPPLDYYRGLAAHYATVHVSLNSTSRQMPGTVNQRLFDAPLAGSAVLTDAQPDLEELFEPGRETLVYHTLDEAVALADEAAADGTRRAALVERARARILDRHLYRHRLRALLDEMGRSLGAGAPGAAAGRRPALEEREAACISM